MFDDHLYKQKLLFQAKSATFFFFLLFQIFFAFLESIGIRKDKKSYYKLFQVIKSNSSKVAKSEHPGVKVIKSQVNTKNENQLEGVRAQDKCLAAVIQTSNDVGVPTARV